MLHIKLHSKDKHAKKFELYEPKYYNYIFARKKLTNYWIPQLPDNFSIYCLICPCKKG